MSIQKKLLAFSLALLALPMTIIIVLMRILYYRMQWVPSTEFEQTQTVGQILMNNYSLILTVLGIIAFILILITGYHFLRSIMEPLKSLRIASWEISQGNLDVSISPQSQDEFKPVFEQFEEMRYRLKDLLWQQVESEKTRTDMVANIAHDLKTPITSISGYAQGLLDGVASDEQKREKYLHTILNKAAELNSMAETLYAFSRLDLKLMNFDCELIPAKEYIESVIRDIKLSRSKIEFESKVDLNPDSMILIDLVQCQRVINNIVDNSVKYANNDGVKLTVSAYENEESAIFCFCDNGRGVSKDELDKLFERFYRSDTARQNSGSGLGLSIAKQIISGQEGAIWARPSPGHGLSILFSFPKQKGTPS